MRSSSCPLSDTIALLVAFSTRNRVQRPRPALPRYAARIAKPVSTSPPMSLLGTSLSNAWLTRNAVGASTAACAIDRSALATRVRRESPNARVKTLQVRRLMPARSRYAVSCPGARSPSVERLLHDEREVGARVAVADARVGAVQPAQEHGLGKHRVAEAVLARARHPVDELAEVDVLAERPDALERAPPRKQARGRVAGLRLGRAEEPRRVR